MAGEEKQNNIVGFGNLRVLITNDDGSWFAKALEIDYAAEGSSFEEVKKRFEKGLQATIAEHLKVFGNIENLLKTVVLDISLSNPQAATIMWVYCPG